MSIKFMTNLFQARVFKNKKLVIHLDDFLKDLRAERRTFTQPEQRFRRCKRSPKTSSSWYPIYHIMIIIVPILASFIPVFNLKHSRFIYLAKS